jgi:hypothetical protein
MDCATTVAHHFLDSKALGWNQRSRTKAVKLGATQSSQNPAKCWSDEGNRTFVKALEAMIERQAPHVATINS